MQATHSEQAEPPQPDRSAAVSSRQESCLLPAPSLCARCTEILSAFGDLVTFASCPKAYVYIVHCYTSTMP